MFRRTLRIFKDIGKRVIDGKQNFPSISKLIEIDRISKFGLNTQQQEIAPNFGCIQLLYKIATIMETHVKIETPKIVEPGIGSYGIIGNMQTGALISENDASINWLCFPKFDSASCFGRLLDYKKGGYFSIKPTSLQEEIYGEQEYYSTEIRGQAKRLPTNVLVTKFAESSIVSDFMPVSKDKKNCIVRMVEAIDGKKVSFKMECLPAFDFARQTHKIELDEKTNIAKFISSKGDFQLYLLSSVKLEIYENKVCAHFEVAKGQPHEVFILLHSENDLKFFTYSTEDIRQRANQLRIETESYWADWISPLEEKYQGSNKEAVLRSALALKLLTYEKTGAILAALTTSLPENIGGERNWDYRYTWVRDACFTAQTFLRIGYLKEAQDYMKYLEKKCIDETNEYMVEKCREELQKIKDLQSVCQKAQQVFMSMNVPNKLKDFMEFIEKPSTNLITSPLKLMNSIDHGEVQVETILKHLSGHKNSTPVRIGNGASHQLQLDIYGELLDFVYDYHKAGLSISEEFWSCLCTLVDWVCENYQRRDSSIWEPRGSQQHFLFSKVLCWVCLDRAIKLAKEKYFEQTGLPLDKLKWKRVRDEIRRDIMMNGYHKEKRYFTQHYGSDDLDASVLYLYTLKFVQDFSTDLWVNTIDMIMDEKNGLYKNQLLYRYKSDDGVKGTEGTFAICSFWLIEALCHVYNSTKKEEYKKKIKEQWAKLVTNPVGNRNAPHHMFLYSEELDEKDSTMLGNFPQAFTHLALINADLAMQKIL